MTGMFYNESLDTHIRFDGDGFVIMGREEDVTDDEVLALHNDGECDGWVRV